MEPEGDVHSFLFADLVGFTALTEIVGDQAAADMAIEFADEARTLAAEYGVEWVKAIGDAVMVRGSAAQVVQLAVRLAQNATMAPGRPPVHIGIHTGPAVARDGDWYGTTVNVAAHLADCARAGEVLLTVSTRRRMGRDLAYDLIDRGRRRLRNVGSPVRVFEARPASAGAVPQVMAEEAA
jgi:adenylate cyclase